ncbi:pyruvoyl-dependent arginine decarboxylase [Haloplanus aerogenes]|uniref:arginine decarboxylase n=1 Tax=Haloplanus aerogenes TaxID=660522 RepID=A0A3M0D9R7_9EURY|nr:pyruvoyl-dependent arginine decarboxylase [Haloplanus aerogenes]AZH26363.1 pyruvoyl-dependent arginine decarboxylase [Haloplanus aerogenes]RMB18174.1 arginine decarboxylase [Haloplanus aerogenes]
MDIEIVWGTGEGKTTLSAFDKALSEGGIHNYNLVTLSSVIPEGATVVEQGTHEQRWDVGELVAVILAENESLVQDETIAAGLGWATAEEGGVFFEGSGESASNVEKRITRGIETAKETRDSWTWHDGIEMKVVEHTVEQAGAVVVSAVHRPV